MHRSGPCVEGSGKRLRRFSTHPCAKLLQHHHTALGLCDTDAPISLMALGRTAQSAGQGCDVHPIEQPSLGTERHGGETTTAAPSRQPVGEAGLRIAEQQRIVA